MINTLFLPELRDMIATGKKEEMREFCAALHPVRTAEFMEGLSSSESWQVLRCADNEQQQEIFRHFDGDKQVSILEQEDRKEVAGLITKLAHDERVDLLGEIDEEIGTELLKLLPAEERRDILRLKAFPEETAGAVMTTDIAKLDESLTVEEALEELGRQAEDLETIYYLYVVDKTDHLRGVVSARQLVSAMVHPKTTLATLMETDIIVVDSMEDQESVAQTVARFDLLAIPVVDPERRLLGIITHDDVIDVMREEATEDVQRIAAVTPLNQSYLRTNLLTLSWKRGVWLTILFFAALLTAFALDGYRDIFGRADAAWLVLFIPLVISSGGNSGSQSSTLVISGLATKDIVISDWWRIFRRELAMGLLLGSLLGIFGYLCAVILAPSPMAALIIPITLLLVMVCGTTCGSLLPLLFQRLGLDPAMMSNPFVAGIVDILGIIIYMNVARLLMN
ncbi:MAG: magnesium transporter [Planctomycetota bacterium]|nr:magnesium transporter [Planctomycetota bacterium]